MTRHTPDLVKAILHAVVGTSLADRQIQDEERAVLRAIVEQYDLEEGELVAALEEGGSPVQLDGGTSGSLERAQLMRYAVLAAQADGKIDRREVGYLQDLGSRLGLSSSEWAELEEFSTELFHATRGGKVNDANIRGILRRYVG